MIDAAAKRLRKAAGTLQFCPFPPEKCSSPLFGSFVDGCCARMVLLVAADRMLPSPPRLLRRTSAAAMRAASGVAEGAQERSGRPEPALVPCGGVAPRIFHLTHVDQGYNAEELREIFRLIDWMMHLPGDLDREFIYSS